MQTNLFYSDYPWKNGRDYRDKNYVGTFIDSDSVNYL